MNVSLKEEYKGRLGLRYDYETHACDYVITQRAYPSYEPEVIKIEEGDLLTIRSPHDGSIIIHRIVELEYDTGLLMDIETGKYRQFIAGHPVNGIPPNIEPVYWFNMFTQEFPADLVKHV